MEVGQQGNLGNMEKYIVGATGVGYLITSLLQLQKGATANAVVWLGYSFSQVGMWLLLK